MAKDLPSFIAKEGATREGAVIREKNFIDANNYETVAYLKHLGRPQRTENGVV